MSTKLVVSVATNVGAMRWMRSIPSVRRFFRHPAITAPHHSCLVSSNTLTDFSEGSSAIPIGYYSSSVEF
ncbi:hypothetical protein TNCV_220981 [Trichonephila clavipes]|nr:hypothetical protein TNCV_220981 [Trichonephila clavipes]